MLNKKLRKSPQCNRALSKYFLHCRDKYFHAYKESLSQTRWLKICRRKSGRGRQRLDGRSLSKVATGGQISLAVQTSFLFGALSLTVSPSLPKLVLIGNIHILDNFLAVESNWLYLLSLMLLTAWLVKLVTLYLFFIFFCIYIIL